jgi:phosphatidylglycerol lysyltransferase
METLLIKYGYFLLFLGIAVEGEAFLLAGSFLAHRGYFSLQLVILVAVLSNCAADIVYYILARTRGRAWLDRRFAQNQHYRRALELAERHGNWILLISRYAFGFRIIIPAACGALRMPPVRFTLINLIAGIIWAVPTALLGFYFGSAAETLIERTQQYEFAILMALVAAGIAIFAFRHAHRTGWIENLHMADLHVLAPWMIGLMGLLNLISASWPRSHSAMSALESWFPLEVTQGSRPLMILAGVALIQVTRGLARRKEAAWYVASIALVTSLLLHITRAFDLHHSLIAGLLLAYLIYFRRRFHARSDPASVKQGLVAIPVLLAVVFLYGYVGLRHMHDRYIWIPGATPINEAIRSGILIVAPQVEPVTPHAARFLSSLQVGGWLVRFYLLVLLLRPVILRRRAEAPKDRIDEIFAAHGEHSLAAFAVQQDKHHLLLCEGRALVAYAVRSHVALACGDPLASEQDLDCAVREYLAHCVKNGWTPCIYEGAGSNLLTYRRHGLQSLKIAEESILDLSEFSLAGGKRANIRAMVNKVAKTGMTVRRYERKSEADPAIDEQLERISEEWLREKRLGELGFTMGRFSLEGISDVPVFICLSDERVEAFCSWLPYRNGQAVVLDLMRKRKSAVAGTMDFMLSHSLLLLRAQGIREASLANAPLANVAGPRGGLERGVALLFENMNGIYGYKNLFQFKKKFAPRWEGRHLIYPGGTDLPKVALALTQLHSSGGFLSLIMRR